MLLVSALSSCGQPHTKNLGLSAKYAQPYESAHDAGLPGAGSRNAGDQPQAGTL